MKGKFVPLASILNAATELIQEGQQNGQQAQAPSIVDILKALSKKGE